jgi:hypothetical protein
MRERFADRHTRVRLIRGQIHLPRARGEYRELNVSLSRIRSHATDLVSLRLFPRDETHADISHGNLEWNLHRVSRLLSPSRTQVYRFSSDSAAISWGTELRSEVDRVFCTRAFAVSRDVSCEPIHSAVASSRAMEHTFSRSDYVNRYAIDARSDRASFAILNLRPSSIHTRQMSENICSCEMCCSSGTKLGTNLAASFAGRRTIALRIGQFSDMFKIRDARARAHMQEFDRSELLNATIDTALDHSGSTMRKCATAVFRFSSRILSAITRIFAHTHRYHRTKRVRAIHKTISFPPSLSLSLSLSLSASRCLAVDSSILFNSILAPTLTTY